MISNIKKLIFFIFIFINLNSIQANTTSKQVKNIVTNIIKIKIASRDYLRDIHFWPSSVKELINKNYLDINNHNAYIIFVKNGILNIAIKIKKKDKHLLIKYLPNSFFDKEKSLFYIKVNPNLSKIKKYKPTGFFCSNLYCP